MQPSRANKKPTDLGVQGLAATKAAIEAIQGPSKAKPVVVDPKDNDEFASASWGKESADVVEKKARYSRDARVRQMNKNQMALYVASMVVRVFIVQKLARGQLAKLAGESKAKYVVWTLVAIVCWAKWGAAPVMHKSILPRLPFIGSLVQLALNKHRFHDYILECLRSAGFTNGEITVPTGMYAAVMDARDREHVLKTNFRNYLKNRENDMGSTEYTLGELLGRGIFATDKREWQDARKIASHMFSGSSLKAKMEDVFNRHADKVVELLDNKVANTGKPIDMQEVFQCAIFDAFCEIAFGHYPNATEAAFEGSKPPFLVAFDNCQSIATERFLMLPVVWHIQRFFGLGNEGVFARSLKVIEEYVDPIIEQRKKDLDVNGKNDLLSLYINHARETNQPHMLDKEYLRDTIVNFMIAGRDTTSCTLAYTMKFIGENPEVESRLLNEALLPISKNATVTWDDTRTVPFADAVFNETLRMAPPVGDDIRICVSDDVWPSGMKVRDGTRVIVPNVAIGRDPFLWANPDKYDPERWMAYDENGLPSPVKRVDEFVHPVFFSGRRLCLGKDMARFESIVFMTKLFTKLRVIPQPVDNTEMSTGPVIFIKGGNLCLIEKRA